jgi:hypothetical protein
MDEWPLPAEGGTCPQCGHSEDKQHTYWSPDSWCDGWSVCFEDDCQCFRLWAGHPPSEAS